MSKTSIYCLTLEPGHEQLIKRLSYIPVGLGEKKFSKDFLSDKNGLSISQKNSNYGEYTFHYWLWKNRLNKIESEWIGFCQYRKFFTKKDITTKDISFENLQSISISEIDDNNFDCILGNKFSVENYKFSKIVKNHLLNFLKNPSLIFNKKKRNLKFHFDLFHGEGNLDKAINLLNEKDKNAFREFMNNETSFNPHNMFICKTKILKSYYDVIFPWLEKCEEVFGINKLKGYGLQRIYGFLAERFLSYWFNRNFKVKECPIIVKDLSDYK